MQYFVSLQGWIIFHVWIDYMCASIRPLMDTWAVSTEIGFKSLLRNNSAPVTRKLALIGLVERIGPHCP